MTKTPTYALIRDSGLTTTAKAILWALDARHGKDGGIFPSVRQLALDTSMDRSNVFHWIRALQETSVLTVLRTKGRSNRYSINFDELLSADERMARRGGGASATSVVAVARPTSGGSATLRVKEESNPRTKGNAEILTHEGMDSPRTEGAKEDMKPDSPVTLGGMLESASADLTKLWGQPPTEKQLAKFAVWAKGTSPAWVLDTLERRPKGSDVFPYMEEQYRLAIARTEKQKKRAKAETIERVMLSLRHKWPNDLTGKESQLLSYMAMHRSWEWIGERIDECPTGTNPIEYMNWYGTR
jgi:hypothetical protein